MTIVLLYCICGAWEITTHQDYDSYLDQLIVYSVTECE